MCICIYCIIYMDSIFTYTVCNKWTCWIYRIEFAGHQILLDLEQHKILRYVETRWLSILPVAERVLEQLAALRELFKSLNSRKDNKSLKNQPRLSVSCALWTSQNYQFIWLLFAMDWRLFSVMKRCFIVRNQWSIVCIMKWWNSLNVLLPGSSNQMCCLRLNMPLIFLIWSMLIWAISWMILNSAWATVQGNFSNTTKINSLNLVLKKYILRHGLSMLKHLRRYCTNCRSILGYWKISVSSTLSSGWQQILWLL